METVYLVSFYIIAVLMTVFAVLALTSKNIVHSLISALISFLMTGLLIVFLGFSYLGVVVISLCSAEIIVFFIFSVMFAKNKDKIKYKRKNLFRITAFLILSAVVMFTVFEMYNGGYFGKIFQNDYIPSLIGSKEFAEQIFVNYGAPFVLMSAAFLSSVLGFGVILSDKDVEGDRK